MVIVIDQISVENNPDNKDAVLNRGADFLFFNPTKLTIVQITPLNVGFGGLASIQKRGEYNHLVVYGSSFYQRTTITTICILHLAAILALNTNSSGTEVHIQ